MKKIELKHIAPYLPYGLKGKIMNGRYYYASNTGLVKALQYKCILSDHIVRVEEWNPDETEMLNEDVYVHRDRFKPILRPLSYLTKEELRSAGFDSHIDYLTHEHQANPEKFQVKKAPYEMVQYLISKHYDIVGLIESGLAIDVNTL